MRIRMNTATTVLSTDATTVRTMTVMTMQSSTATTKVMYRGSQPRAVQDDTVPRQLVNGVWQLFGAPKRRKRAEVRHPKQTPVLVPTR
ncbi:hypothetical protein GCM10011415_01500 [Salipiger pallidus]|uniref:Uncharacterized protein n=1 Tax=Salipiger pallidus TaxID=1775170 RepID=A0A8J2ZGE7_9RHOB|nr:hypothetical protein [Salipiger pallidus]GGG59352.1 hypothetical protein GCM10011415_01500 [Salipiger pallidus]